MFHGPLLVIFFFLQPPLSNICTIKLIGNSLTLNQFSFIKLLFEILLCCFISLSNQFYLTTVLYV